MMSELGLIPDHVPPERVVDFDFYAGPEVSGVPYVGLSRLHDGPDIFYTPRNGGHWVATRAKDARVILMDNEHFSVDLRYNSRPEMDETGPRMIPAMVDPPTHTRYRRLINPPFSAASVAKLEQRIRELSRSLIETVRPRGGCEFFAEIAKNFPIAIFLEMADLPMADRDRMLEWADLVTHTPGRQAEGLTKLCDYLDEKIQRRRDNPGDDLLSILATAEFDGVHPSRDILHVAVNVVMGGLDTVVAGLSFIIGYLARHPDHYRRIVEDRGQIKRYLEELMRLHGVACTERHVKSDFEFRGVRLKERDRFVMVPALYGIDPDEVENPLAANFDRGQTHHMLFGTGIHHCVGSHLARLEMRVFLEEWTHAIPEFGLKPGTGIDCIGGFVFQPKAVHLAWDVAATRPVTTDDQRAV